MHYEGSFDIPVPKEKAYSFLTDPKKIATIIPDVERLDILDDNSFSLRARVGVSFIKGTVSMKFRMLEKRLPSYAKLVGRGSGAGSSMDLEMSFTLEDKPEGGSLLKWTTDARVGGLMASVGSRLLDSAAEKYMKQIASSLQAKLAE